MVRPIWGPYDPVWNRKSKTDGEERKKGMCPEQAAFFTVLLKARPALRRATNIKNKQKLEQKL